MAKDDQAARSSRAEELREKIARLKNPDEVADESETAKPGDSGAEKGKSPREFIQDRMRKLDKDR